MDMAKEHIMEDIKALQQIELSILLDVREVCQKHGIVFFLGEGTMLGAVRHNGFIPWDDDMDLIMPRGDYERFLKIAPVELNGKYEVQHSTTVDNYWSPFIKVRLLNHETKYNQQHIAHLTENNGPYIDIFPIEYTSGKDGFKIARTGFFVRFYRGMLSYKLGLRTPAHLKGKVLKLISHFFSVKKIHAGLENTLEPFKQTSGSFMATFLTYHPLRCQIVESSDYAETLEWDFEQYKMPVPIGYDNILTTIYGDYMTPPPEDQRILKHHFYNAD